MKEKIKKITTILNQGLIEREKHIKLSILTILSGENLILLGPPGTAKSEVSRRVSNIVKEKKYFEYLLTKFTTPEEIFGPISIKNLEKDIFKRQTEGYISKSYIVFLDEIFKANSSILNSLLTILNERIYHNGAELEQSKLRSIIASSNELPIGDSELIALYDRFLTRLVIDYVKDPFDLIYIDDKEVILDKDLRLDISELENISEESKNIKIENKIAKTLVKIKQDIEKEFPEIENEISEIISDRKFVKSIKFLKTAAYCNEKSKITLDDLFLLTNIYWNDPININKIKQIIIKNICGIEKNKKEQVNILFESWNKTFNQIFETQETNENDELLYYDIDNNITTEKTGDIHLRDEMGNYLFYSGHRDYIRISKEMASWDHNYEDINIKTINGESIWVYEFSNTKVTKNKKNFMKDFKKLTINGELKPVLIKNYDEFKEKKIKLNKNKKEILNNLKRNIETEYLVLKEHVENISKRKKELEENLNSNIWLENNDRKLLTQKINEYYNMTTNLLDNFNNLIQKTIEAEKS